MSKEKTRLVSPQAPAEYCHLQSPDKTFGGEGQYQVTQIFRKDNPEHVKFLTEVQKTLPQGWNKNPFIKDPEDANIVKLKYTQAARVESNGEVFNFKPAVFDSKGKPIVNVPLLANGSEVKVHIEIHPYTYGKKVSIAIKPLSVQLIKVIEYVPEVKEDANVFSEVEGGFVSDEPSADVFNESPVSDALGFTADPDLPMDDDDGIPTDTSSILDADGDIAF